MTHLDPASGPLLPGDVRLTLTCHANDTLTCELAGELDGFGGDLVLASVQAAAHDPRPLTIALDELRFCGAAGLRLLKEVGDIRAAEGRPVLVSGASDVTVRVLRLMELSPAVDLRSREPADRRSGPPAGDGLDIESRSVAAMPLAELSEAVGSLLPGALGVSVSVARADGFETIVATAASAAELDLAQYDLGEGPCVDAMRMREQTHGEEIDGRWPAFAPHAHRRGVRSIVSTPLGPTGEVGALNVYSRHAALGRGPLHGLGQLAALVGGLVERHRR